MSPSSQKNDVVRLYAPQAISQQERTGPAGQALGHLSDAWQALEALEASLAQELPRWDAESLITARKGTQRAWLALSNLKHSLESQQRRAGAGE